MIEAINAWSNTHQAISLCVVLAVGIIGSLIAYLVVIYKEYIHWNR